MLNTPKTIQTQGISILTIDPEKLHNLLKGLDLLCWSFDAEDYEAKAKQLHKAFKDNPNATKTEREDLKWFRDINIEAVRAIMEIRDVVRKYNFELQKN